MADVQISALEQATTAGTNDYFIINKGDATTQKIDFDTLASAVGGAFAPIFYNFSGNGSFSTVSWDETDKNLYSVSSGAIQMPAGANAAIIYCEHGYKAVARSGITAPGQTYVRIGKGFDFSGPGMTVVNGGGSNSVAMGFTVAFPHEQPANQGTDRAQAQGLAMRNTKTAMMTFNEGASITVTSTAIHYCSKQVDFTMSTGRMILLPYNTANSSFSALAEVFSGDDELEGNMPPVTPEESEIQRNSILRGKMRFLLDQGDNAVQYDPNLNDTDKQTLIDEMGNLHTLKTSTGTYEQIDAEVDRIHGVMADILQFKFDWQSTTGSYFM